MEAGLVEGLFPFFSFDADLLKDLFPSLLIFSFAAFAFIFALPRLREWLKTRLDQKLAFREARETNYFSLAYCLRVTKYLTPLAILYLGGTFLILLAVLNSWLCIPAFALILFTTTVLLARFFITLFPVLRQSRISLRVTTNFPIHLLLDE